jgi:hypothetical protein
MRSRERTQGCSAAGVRSFAGSQPPSESPCRPFPIEQGLGVLVGLVAEVPIDPLDHRHGRSRHAGDQEKESMGLPDFYRFGSQNTAFFREI